MSNLKALSRDLQAYYVETEIEKMQASKQVFFQPGNEFMLPINEV